MSVRPSESRASQDVGLIGTTHPILRWVLPVRDLHASRVVAGSLIFTPGGHDAGQDGAAVDGSGDVWGRDRNVSVLAIEEARVRGVEEDGIEGWGGPLANRVAGLGSDEGEDIGADVPAAESVEAPVGFYGGDLGVVVVKVAVRGADEAFGDGVAEEDAHDPVLLGIRLRLVEGEEHKRVVHEIGIDQERREEVLGPEAGDCDGGIVAVICHVGSDEHPLGKLVVC